MSEPIWVNVKIGVSLPTFLIDQFIDLVEDNLSELSGPTKREEIEELFGNDHLNYNGTAEYGLCESLLKFCIQHNLTYCCEAQAKGEYSPDTTYWKPGQKEATTYPTDSVGNAIIRVEDVRPLIKFMLGLLEDGDEALPKFLNDPSAQIQDLVRKGFNDYQNLIPEINKVITRILPIVGDDVPVITALDIH